MENFISPLEGTPVLYETYFISDYYLKTLILFGADMTGWDKEWESDSAQVQ